MQAATTTRETTGARHWWTILLALKDQIARDRLSIAAAGVAFYAILAALPALTGTVAVYGLLLDSERATAQVAALGEMLPPQARELLIDELRELVQRNRGALGWGAAGALLFTVWSAARATRTVIEALNLAFGERDRRSFARRAALALLLTLAGVLSAALALALLVFFPAAVHLLGLRPLLGDLIGYARWPIFAALAAGGIAVLYRYGPCRRGADWKAIGWGAGFATALWLAGSALFSHYVADFGSYNRVYGSLAGFVILLLWFLLSAYAVLLGAELTALLERNRRVARPGR